MCGPTVYDSTHMGHAYTYMQFDLVRRVIAKSTPAPAIVTCLNVTDIDDKIFQRSLSTGEQWHALANRYEDEFWEALRRLHVLMPTLTVRVSESIPAVVAFVECLLASDAAYVGDSGSVYYDVRASKYYGRLAPMPEASKRDVSRSRDMWENYKKNMEKILHTNSSFRK